ncbi:MULTISPECIES: C39 family peptidase [Niastella]|uniref:C39 family peptidase n=1 Tax=Niastella soli TaxID=2821487 RepID=A0ABS3Z5I4_9BACT|nr:papain-like cysteine protease family protein [Niastella soli]MBO9205399.1 C39 family peptidase [Niastella soli]
MKKLLFLTILLLGLVPYINNGSLQLATPSAMAQDMGEENDWDDDFGDDWWDDMTDEEFSGILDDGGFYDDFYQDIEDDFNSWFEDDAWDVGADDGSWTFLETVYVYANTHTDDGIDWGWLDAVTVTASSNSGYDVDDTDWSWLMNEMVYKYDPYITGYDPGYSYPDPILDPPPVEDKPKPKYVKKNIKLRIRVQNSQMTCVPTTMSYLNEVVCGGSHSENWYISDYESSHSGADVEANGIPLSEMSGYVNAEFNTETYNGFAIDYLDAGKPILTTIQNSQGYHSVVIIGYDENSSPNNRRLYYVDPETGVQSSILYNDWNTGSQALYAYPISGCKK